MQYPLTRFAARAAACTAAAALAFAVGAAPQKYTGPQPAKAPAVGDAMVFVRFEAPAVSEMVLAQRAAGRASVARAAQIAYAQRITAGHAAWRGRLEALGARIHSTMRVGANGMRISVAQDRIAAIRALPGVRSVGPVPIHTLDLTNSTPWIGAPAVWDAVGDGAGISIGIIDTGIDYLHADFGGSGDPDEYANNDFDVIEPGSFPTAKVVGGYDFAGADYNASSDDPAQREPVPDADPLDGNGHGTHVAGIAAGLGVAGIGAGVAKGASLYALKVFGDSSGSTLLTADAIEWSLDPDGDGDMSDMLDVINMSLGSAIGSPDSPSAIAASNAADLGMIVVASAGNSGNTPYVTGSPGVGPNVISVAATRTGGAVPAIAVTSAPAEGRYESLEGVGVVRIADNPVSAPLVVAQPLQACNADAAGLPLGLDNDIDGGIALVQRGGCAFDLKYLNAQISGASAILVYNDGAAPDRVAPITMGGIGNLGIDVTIPGAMIASTAGDFLNDTLTAGNALTAEMDAALTTATMFGDTIASFSSRGPGHGGSTFKPDLSAPGLSTVSVGAGTGVGPRTLSGTSMAAPHIAGAGALMRLAFPDASPAAIKAMLMNSTVDAVPDGLIGPPHPMSRQGVGVARVDRAIELTSYASPAGVSFGYINPVGRQRVRRKVEVTNLSDTDRTYAITHLPQLTMDGVSLMLPDEVTVPAGSTRGFSIVIAVDPRLGPTDGAGFSQNEVDGWFLLDDGEETLRVGYLAAIDPASRISVRGGKEGVRIRNTGNAAGVVEGYTLARTGTGSDGDTASVKAIGYRTFSIGDFDVVELAVDLARPWESMSRRDFNVYLDTDSDGKDDVRLRATDWSEFDGTVGVMVTAQENLATGDVFLDWFVGVGDYNDTVAAFTFTRQRTGGLVPDRFSYRLEVDGEGGDSDTEKGKLDLSREIRVTQPSLVVGPGETVDVGAKRRGTTLWLMQGNPAGRQSDLAKVR